MQGAWLRGTAYLVGVPLLCKDVPNEGLLHFLLLHQELPQTLHGQRQVVARPGANNSIDNNQHSLIHPRQFTGAQQSTLENIRFLI